MSLSELGRDDDAPRRDMLFNIYRACDAEEGVMSTQTAETVARGITAQIDQWNAQKSRIQAAADALVSSGMVPKRVIIEVNDGVARVSYVSPGVEVQIIDHDPEGCSSVIEPLVKEWGDDDIWQSNVCRCVEESDCPHDWEDAR